MKTAFSFAVLPGGRVAWIHRSGHSKNTERIALIELNLDSMYTNIWSIDTYNRSVVFL